MSNSSGSPFGSMFAGLFGGANPNASAPQIDQSQTNAYLQQGTGNANMNNALAMQQAAAQGKGPSLANATLQQQNQAVMAANNALASSGTGSQGQGAARRQAMMQNAAQMQAAGGQAAMARAQEQLGAMNQYGQLANAQAGNQLQAGNISANLASTQAQLAEQQNALNAQAAAQQSQGGANMFSGMLSSAAQMAPMLAMASDERLKVPSHGHHGPFSHLFQGMRFHDLDMGSNSQGFDPSTPTPHADQQAFYGTSDPDQLRANEDRQISNQLLPGANPPPGAGQRQQQDQAQDQGPQSSIPRWQPPSSQPSDPNAVDPNSYASRLNTFYNSPFGRAYGNFASSLGHLTTGPGQEQPQPGAQQGRAPLGIYSDERVKSPSQDVLQQINRKLDLLGRAVFGSKEGRQRFEASLRGTPRRPATPASDPRREYEAQRRRQFGSR